MVKCNNCGEVFDEADVGEIRYNLGDDAWGAGPSWVRASICRFGERDDLDGEYVEDD